VQRPRRPAPTVDGIRAVETSLSFQVSVLAKLIDRQLARLADRFGLSVAEYQVLMQVMLHPQSTVRAIADRTFVDKAQVSRAAAALEEASLVTRSVLAHDRRSPVFTVTRSGRALVNRIVPVRELHEQGIVGSLGAAELARLGNTLQAIIGRLSQPPAAVSASRPPRPRQGQGRTIARVPRPRTD
jgi:DNA-binding MarR family transcriptional regulator